MKRLYFVLITILLVAGCSKLGSDNGSMQEPLYSPVFYAQFEDNTSRTYLDGLLHQRWNKNDQISVFTNTVNQKYQFDGENGDNNGSFSVIASQSSGANNPLNIDANIAVYPYNYNTSISPDGTVSLELPWTQLYTEGSFGLGANPMLAVTNGRNDTDLNFRNLCGFLRLRLYGNDITIRRISLYGHNDEKLHGRAYVNAKYGEIPMMTMSEDASNDIAVYCDNGVKIGSTKEDATDFWFVVPPTIFENGFDLWIEDIDGFGADKSLWNKFSIERNVVKTMTPFEVETSGVNTSQDTYYIDAKGGYIDIDLEYKGKLIIDLPEEAKSWIKQVDTTRASQSKTIRFEIAPLETGDNRSCGFTIIGENSNGSGMGRHITINQGDAIAISSKEFMVYSGRGKFSFEIQANVEFNVSEPNVEWLRRVQTRGMETHTLHYEHDANTEYDDRVAKIVVTNPKNNKADTITVTQMHKSAIVLAKNTYDIDCKGEQIEISVGYNVEYDINISNSWITQVDTRGLSTDTLVFNISKNASRKDRTGTIKFISKNFSSINQTVTIHQFGENAFDPAIDKWGTDDNDYGGSAE